MLKVYSDRSVDLKMTSGSRNETYRRVKKDFVQLDTQKLALGAADEIKKAEMEAETLEKCAGHKLESVIQSSDFGQIRQPLRRHEGLDILASVWSHGQSMDAEKRRLKKYLADERPSFSTRSCRHLRADLATQRLRRDSTDLRDPPPPKPKPKRKLPSLNDLLEEEKNAALELELRTLSPPASSQGPRQLLGSKRNELARRKAQKRKAIQRRKKIVKAVVDAEANLAVKALAYEEQLKLVREELEKSITKHQTAALQTEQIHAFDNTTKCLNQTRWVTCELIEGIKKGLRAAKLAPIAMDPKLAGAAYEEMSTIEDNYDEHADPDTDVYGRLEAPGAMPFIWNGRNVMLDIEGGLDFLQASTELQKWYGKHFHLEGNPFMVVAPLRERAHTPIKCTETVILNGEEVEHVIPRLEKLAGVATRKLREAKDTQFNCSFWWPGRYETS